MFPDAVIFPKKWASFTNVLKGPIINVLPTDNVPTPESPPVAVSSSRVLLMQHNCGHFRKYGVFVVDYVYQYRLVPRVLWSFFVFL